MTDRLDSLQISAMTLIERLLLLLPRGGHVDWSKEPAALWRSHGFGQAFQRAAVDASLSLDDLHRIDHQKAAIERNTRQFLVGAPANNVLLWGARGTGKSSLVHALVNRYAADGLRLVEVSRTDLAGIADLAAELATLPYRFVVFCDDLSFEEDDAGYKALKSALEGSLFKHADNVLIYATSNRRHLLPEYMRDNLQTKMVDGELHEAEAVEERNSLSDRFGLWLSFYPFKQDDYLDVVHHWVRRLARAHGLSLDACALDEAFDKQAVAWALGRGVRSGRTAQHFARHWVGGQLLEK
ncbi:MAG: ATP-binding protein [Pseudomonadales bacterium]